MHSCQCPAVLGLPFLDSGVPQAVPAFAGGIFSVWNRNFRLPGKTSKKRLNFRISYDIITRNNALASFDRRQPALVYADLKRKKVKILPFSLFLFIEALDAAFYNNL
ncbi:MAG: hypothetical protein HFF18_09210 [Oscillospiraceae bacterium]|nr:hypothetical protein [Oscillospiraceae bacterium]